MLINAVEVRVQNSRLYVKYLLANLSVQELLIIEEQSIDNDKHKNPPWKIIQQGRRDKNMEKRHR
jgi:hypothetical protein